MDPIETRDWLQASTRSSVKKVLSVQFLIDQVLKQARNGGLNIAWGGSVHSDYINTIPAEDEPAYPAIWN